MNKKFLFIASAVLVLIASCTTEHVLVECDDCNTSVVVDLSRYDLASDGSEDCSQVINEIINELPESGGVIQFPAGIFLLNNPITIKRNYVVLKGSVAGDGSGRLQSVIRFGNCDYGICVPEIADVQGRKNRISGVEVHNLRISGTDKNRGTGVYIYQDNDRIRIVGSSIDNCRCGLYVRAADACVVSKCSLADVENGLSFYGGIQNTVVDCSFQEVRNGVSCNFERETNLLFSANDCRQDGGINLILHECRHVNVCDNLFEGNSYGMLCLNGSYNSVTGNVINLLGEQRQSAGGHDENFGLIAISGDSNNFSRNTISGDWSDQMQSPVTISVLSGLNNRISNCSISDQRSDKVIYVTSSTKVLSCLDDMSKVCFVD